VTEPNGHRARPSNLRLVDSMPRPLLIIFAVSLLGALGVVAYLLIRPPTFETVALEERRPAPAGVFSHDVGQVFSLPEPDVAAPYDPPCEQVAGVLPTGGARAVARLTETLDLLCTIAGPGVPATIGEAVAGLHDVEIGFAEFRRSGVESVVDFGTRRIWLNVKFAATQLPVRELVPVIVHEAWHLANSDERITAQQEFRARLVELEACRELITPDERPRHCADADALIALGEEAAVGVLVGVGYADAATVS